MFFLTDGFSQFSSTKNDDLDPSNHDLFCPKLNLIKDKIPFLGLDIVERKGSKGAKMQHLHTFGRFPGIVVFLRLNE